MSASSTVQSQLAKNVSSPVVASTALADIEGLASGDDEGVESGVIKLIPICELVSAEHEGNVRTEREDSIVSTGVDGHTQIKQSGDVKNMAETLAHVGQLQNLIVYPLEDGTFAVADGETRRLGTVLRVMENQIPNTHPMMCLVCTREVAFMLSWIANEKRRPVSLSDRLAAYLKLTENGMSREKLAAMNDIPLREVDRVLRLASLHPKIMAYLKKEGMSIDLAVQFAKAPSQEIQLEVFNALGAGKNTLYTHEVGNLLSQTRIGATTPTGKFITAKAYAKAGGQLVGDLFASSDDQKYMDDLTLVSRLVAEKFERLSKKHGKGYAWVETAAHGTEPAFSRCREIPMGGTKTPDGFMEELEEKRKETKALDVIEDELDARYDECSCGDDEEEELEIIRVALKEANENSRAAHSEVWKMEKQLEEKYSFHTDTEKTFSGVLITFDYNGVVEVTRGIQTAADLKNYKSAVSKGEVEAVVEAKSGSTQSDRGGREPMKGPGKFGTDMRLRRRSVARAALARPENVELARAMIECDLCVRILSSIRHEYSFTRHSSIEIPCVSDETSLKDIENSRSHAEIERIKSELRLDWFSEECHRTRLELFAKLPKKKRDALVSFCVAKSMESCQTSESDLPDSMMAVLGADPVTLWRPCRESYFRHMKKDELYELGLGWYGKESAFATQHLKSKKTDLLDAICHLFEANADTLTEAELLVREGWVPSEMSF